MGADEEDSVEEAPDIEALAREQVRQHVTQTFAGHDLADLVGHVLAARGYSSVSVSPPGADRGVDILAGSGPLGLDHARLAVQVKTGQAGVDEYRALRGVMEDFRADQGLLVAWAGFKGTVRNEARTSHFTIRLWDADDFLDALFRAYDGLPDSIRSQLPLKRVLALVPDSE
jgi:restriction system protein